MGQDYIPDFYKPRDRHLFAPGPKRILALDGGGIRGLITLGILSRIEETLGAQSNDPENFVLAHYFDLIAGTSTGSIIATALAMGWKVEQVRKLYQELGPTLFPPTRTIGILRFKRDAEKLNRILREKLGKDDGGGDMTLDSERFMTGLLICAKRIDTDSAWILTNNPKSKYWTSETGAWTPNSKYEVAMIVRASAAAPTYFEPVSVVINDGANGYAREEGLFVDGAISGHNNPAVTSIMTSTLPSYGFGDVSPSHKPKGWEMGPDKMLVINVGTGWYRERKDPKSFMKKWPAQQAIDGLKGMINDTVRNDLMLLQSMSNPKAPWWLNSETEHLEDELMSPSPLISFQRYDGRLNKEIFTRAIGMSDATHSKKEMEAAYKSIMEMDNGSKQNIHNAYEFGRWVAESDPEDEALAPAERHRQSVKFDHFPEAFNDVLQTVRPLPESVKGRAES